VGEKHHIDQWYRVVVDKGGRWEKRGAIPRAARTASRKPGSKAGGLKNVQSGKLAARRCSPEHAPVEALRRRRRTMAQEQGITPNEEEWR